MTEQRELRDASGRYISIQQGDVTADDPYGNFVLYELNADGSINFSRPIWDKRSFEAGQPNRPGQTPPAPPAPPPATSGPGPSPPSSPSPVALGGFSVASTDTSSRPADVNPASFLPSRGAFTFPAPWDTRGVRVTNGDDGTIEPGYAYWRRINAHRGSGELLVILGRGNDNALLAHVDKASGSVRIEQLDLRGTGEQWYFSAHEPDIVFITEGARHLRYNVRTGERQTVMEVGNDAILWQCHASGDERSFSGTVRSASSWEPLGAFVSRPAGQSLIPREANFDECQIDKSGAVLQVKETVGETLTNRFVFLDAGEVITRTAAEGAVGHSDMGYGYVVGETGFAFMPAFLKQPLRAPLPASAIIYHTTDWQAMTRHVSHTNAPQPMVLISSASRNNVPRANELVLAPLDGSLRCYPIAPNMTNLDAWLPGDDRRDPSDRDYRKMPFAHLDAYGEWALFMSNCGGSRLDAFLVQVPAR